MLRGRIFCRGSGKRAISQTTRPCGISILLVSTARGRREARKQCEIKDNQPRSWYRLHRICGLLHLISQRRGLELTDQMHATKTTGNWKGRTAIVRTGHRHCNTRPRHCSTQDLRQPRPSHPHVSTQPGRTLAQDADCVRSPVSEHVRTEKPQKVCYKTPRSLFKLYRNGMVFACDCGSIALQSHI